MPFSRTEKELTRLEDAIDNVYHGMRWDKEDLGEVRLSGIQVRLISEQLLRLAWNILRYDDGKTDLDVFRLNFELRRQIDDLQLSLEQTLPKSHGKTFTSKENDDANS